MNTFLKKMLATTSVAFVLGMTPVLATNPHDDILEGFDYKKAVQTAPDGKELKDLDFTARDTQTSVLVKAVEDAEKAYKATLTTASNILNDYPLLLTRIQETETKISESQGRIDALKDEVTQKQNEQLAIAGTDEYKNAPSSSFTPSADADKTSLETSLQNLRDEKADVDKRKAASESIENQTAANGGRPLKVADAKKLVVDMGLTEKDFNDSNNGKNIYTSAHEDFLDTFSEKESELTRKISEATTKYNEEKKAYNDSVTAHTEAVQKYTDLQTEIDAITDGTTGKLKKEQDDKAKLESDLATDKGQASTDKPTYEAALKANLDITQTLKDVLEEDKKTIASIHENEVNAEDAAADNYLMKTNATALLVNMSGLGKKKVEDYITSNDETSLTQAITSNLGTGAGSSSELQKVKDQYAKAIKIMMSFAGITDESNFRAQLDSKTAEQFLKEIEDAKKGIPNADPTGGQTDTSSSNSFIL